MLNQPKIILLIILNSDMPLKFGGGPKCKKCTKTVYKAEEVISEAGTFHKLCFRCSSCNKGLDSFSLTVHDETLFCKSCYGKKFGPKGYGFGGGAAGLMSAENDSIKTATDIRSTAPAIPPTKLSVSSDGSGSNKSQSFKENFRPGNDRCPRCNDRVYYAEKVVANGINWHKRCLRCAVCGKTLDSTNLNEHDEEIYCKACYGKNFGPKGFGYGLGAGTLQMT